MKNSSIRNLVGASLLFALLFISCDKGLTKYDAFPHMYEERPISILVLPPINESTAADAKDYYVTTVAEPLSLTGYYVFPIEVVTEALQSEGIYDTEILDESAIPKFKEYFGADAVLFIRILEWNTSYSVVEGSVKVKVAYKLVSTTTSETLWKAEAEKKKDTTADSSGIGGLAGFFVEAIVTAVETATTDYVPLAKEANFEALVSIPYGKYHPQYEKDRAQYEKNREAKVVKEKLSKTEEAEKK